MSLILSGTDGLSDVDGTAATPAIRGTDSNTGIFFPAADTVGMSTGGSERMRIDSSGNVGIGTASPAAKLDVRGSSTFLVNAANPTAWISVDSALTTGSVYNQWNTTSSIGITGTYTNHPYTFVTNNTERLRIESSGNVLVTNPAGLGYGTGSGGTVTQATSKSTGVTLNKPTGVITMNNAALAANTTVAFACINSMAAAIDTVVLTPLTSTIDMSFYSWGAAMNGAGNIQIYLRNISGGSRSEAVVFNFAIIKGATS